MILSLIEIENRKLNNLIKKLISLNDRIKGNKSNYYNSLYLIIKDNPTKVHKKYISQVIGFIIKSSFSISFLPELIKIYINKYQKKEIESFVLDTLQIKSIDEIVIDNHLPYDLFKIFRLLGSKPKSQITNIINEALSTKFNYELYYNSLLNDLIKPYDNKDLFNRFLSCVPDLSQKRKEDHPPDNRTLKEVINIIYKCELEITEEFKNLVNKSSAEQKNYFEWLLNLENFDYSKFNSYWILEGYTEHYIKAFKKSNKLMEELKKSLKNDYIEGVAKIYFDKLVN